MKEFKKFLNALSEQRSDRYKDVSKAIFVTGCPGSGKDVVIREIISQAHITELNHQQVYKFLADKDNLGKRSHDLRLESIRKHGSLIINAPADDIDKILYIKEELEELNYDVLMLYVHTSDDISKERNEKLSRSLEESVRQDKWLRAESNKEVFESLFENFLQFNNIHSLNESVYETKDIYKKINTFLLEKVKLKYQAAGPDDITPDNRAGQSGSVGDSIKGDTPARKNPDKTYTFRTYSEQSKPTMSFRPEPKVPEFNKDKEVKNKKRFKDSPTQNQRIRNTSGVGPEFDTRQQGTVYPMSGLGDVTYREQKAFTKFRSSLNEYNGFQNDDAGMGVGGVLGGATNKEPMQSYKDQDKNIGILIKKKKGKKNV
jgi:hypothetical protein